MTEERQRDIAPSTLRLSRSVYDGFKRRARNDGFVHVIDCLQVVIHQYSKGRIQDAAIKKCPAGLEPAGPRRNKPYTWTLKIERKIWEAFKARTEKAWECPTDCLRQLVAGYESGKIRVGAVAA